ncbi:hypothetical protein [Kaarinaea lacus]
MEHPETLGFGVCGGLSPAQKLVTERWMPLVACALANGINNSTKNAAK